MKKSLALLSASALLSALAPTQLHAEENVPKSLVLRLLKCPSDCLKDMKLLIGQVPAPLAATLPIPEKATIVATLIRNRNSTEIVLDAPQSPGEVRSQIKLQLEAKGWKSALNFLYDQQRGFVASNASISESFNFCNSKDNSALYVVADRPSTEVVTDVRFYLTSESEDCKRSAAISREIGSYRDPQSSMPRLIAPIAVKAEDTTWGGSGDEAYARATLETSLSSTALHKAYADQLDRAGWKKQTQQEQGKVISSTWTFRDSAGQEHQGLLILTTKDKPNQFSGVVLVTKP